MANSSSNDCFDDWVWSVNWTMASEVAWHSLATRARELGTKQWTDRNEKAPVLFVSVSVVQVNSLFRKLVYLWFQAWALEFKSRDVFISREQLPFSHWKKKKRDWGWLYLLSRTFWHCNAGALAGLHCVKQRVLTRLSCRPPCHVLLVNQWAQIRKLKACGVFEPRTATGWELFSCLSCLLITIFRLLSVSFH